MTEERLALSELLEKTGDGDFLRAVTEAVLQLLMEADVDGLIGAGRYERSGERTTWGNGYRWPNPRIAIAPAGTASRTSSSATACARRSERPILELGVPEVSV